MVSFLSASAGLPSASLLFLVLLLITSVSAAPHPGSQIHQIQDRHFHQQSLNKQRRVLRPVRGDGTGARSDAVVIGKRSCKPKSASQDNNTTSVVATPTSSIMNPSSTETASSTPTMLSSPISVSDNYASTDNVTTPTSSLSSLFPLGIDSALSEWTTSTASSSALSFVDALPVSKGKLPTVDIAPDGSESLIAYYPKGSINLANPTAPHGGFSFYTSGPEEKAAIGKATEITFSYSVWFQEGFEYQLGGKLPGVYGGSSEDVAVSCSGGREDQRDQCFSIRNMWRTNGAGELYSYLPTSVSQPSTYCNYPPKSICSSTYGDSVGRGSFYFTAGEWTTVTQRVRLNDIGQANGILELYVNGVQKIALNGLTLRVSSDVIFRGIMAQTFFGGSSTPYASPQDQYTYFKDFSLAIIE